MEQGEDRIEKKEQTGQNRQDSAEWKPQTEQIR